MKLELWCKIKQGAFSFSPFNKLKITEFLKGRNEKDVKMTLEDKEKPKSEEFLGWYWAGLLPAYIAYKKHNLTQAQLDFNPLILDDMLKDKRITKDEIDDWHNTLMTEFRPYIVYNLKGEPSKQRGEMKKMNNKEAVEYATEVYGYYLDNGIPVPDNEKFKKAKMLADLVREVGYDKAVKMDKKEKISYPTDYDSSKIAF